MRAFLFSLLVMSVPAAAETLYFYEIHVGTPKYAEGYMDRFTQAFARVLKETGYDQGCVDLRRLYQFKADPIVSLGNKLKVVGVLQLLTKQPLDPFPVEELRTALCEGLDERCDLRGYVQSVDTSDLTLSRSWRTGSLLAESRPLKSKTFAMPTMDTFPRFSTSCETGKTDESIFLSARSRESRVLLKAAGISLNDTVSVRLMNKGRLFWGFGPPDANWTEAPVNHTDGPLVPPGILDELQ